MCKECESDHKHYTCECGREFDSGSKLGGHQKKRNCQFRIIDYVKNLNASVSGIESHLPSKEAFIARASRVRCSNFNHLIYNGLSQHSFMYLKTGWILGRRMSFYKKS